MEGLLIGQDLEKADAYGNTADPNKIANPDNLTYSNDLNTLFIGEDSSLHTNNFVWAYNVKPKTITHPFGSSGSRSNGTSCSRKH